MNLLVLIRTSWKALRRNVSRSLLTMLGIIIGVGAVIASMSIGSGAQAAVLKQIESLGANLIIITPGAISSGGVSLGSGSRTTLKLDDITAISRNVFDIQAVAPFSSTSAQVVAGSTNWFTSIGGTTPAWITVQNWDMSQGQFFTEDDLTRSA